MGSKNYHKELIRRIALHDDHAAFEILFDIYYNKLVKVAAYFLGADTYAEDVVSEVFIKFLALGGKMKQIKNPDQYFFVATKNQALTLRSKNSRYLFNETQLNLKISVTEDYPEDIMIRKEIVEVMNQTIDNFPIKRRIIFQMIKEENLSYKEAADRMEISVKAVEKHMRLAMQSLRTNLGNFFQHDLLNDTPALKISVKQK